MGGWIHGGVEGGVNFAAMALLRRNGRNGPGDKVTGKQGKLGVAWLGAVADVNVKHRGARRWATAERAQGVGLTTHPASQWRLGTERRKGWQVRENDGVVWQRTRT